MALLRILLLFTVALRIANAFTPSLMRSPSISTCQATFRQSCPTRLQAKNYDEDDDEDDDDEELDLSDSDWRDFRAKLVMSETKQDDTLVEDDEGDLDGIGSIFLDASRSPTASASDSSTQKMTPLDPSQWAYESGKVIEQGAVILGGVEQAFGFGLRQQYFHKAAILVLDHDPNVFTKGIILNRPTDLTLEDDTNPGVRWRVWFGGVSILLGMERTLHSFIKALTLTTIILIQDVQGLGSPKPDIVCLHSLQNEQAAKASIKVMKDIQWTSFENAKRLVQIGAAQPTDFWVFIGYAGKNKIGGIYLLRIVHHQLTHLLILL